VDKNETVALMAATIYTAEASGQATDAEAVYGRIATQAWALYEAVEREAAERHSRR
jgi:hypothetical protein